MKRDLSPPEEKRSPPLRSEAPSLYAYAESNPSPILITDTKGEILFVNSAWERLTGYKSNEACGRNPRFLGSGKTPEELYKKIWDSLREGNSFESEGFVDKRKDGTEFSIRSVFFPVKINDATTYFVQVLQDITERKEIEKRKDIFISAASHEMRNPLSTIMFSLELLKHNLGSIPNEAGKTLKLLQDETGRFKELLNYLLDISKLHTSVLKINKQEFELQELIQKVVAELQPVQQTHTILFEVGAPVKVLCDEARIAQVLINLISNAVKYSPQADRVLIRAIKNGDTVVISVQDFGLGIAQEEQAKVFDILYRAKNKGAVEGSGLGLYISAQIVQAHGGRIWLTSEHGKGSNFYFSLPIR